MGAPPALSGRSRPTEDDLPSSPRVAHDAVHLGTLGPHEPLDERRVGLAGLRQPVDLEQRRSVDLREALLFARTSPWAENKRGRLGLPVGQSAAGKLIMPVRALVCRRTGDTGAQSAGRRHYLGRSRRRPRGPLLDELRQPGDFLALRRELPLSCAIQKFLRSLVAVRDLAVLAHVPSHRNVRGERPPTVRTAKLLFVCAGRFDDWGA